MTSLLWLTDPSIGVANVAARELGVLAGRNWLLSLLISLLRLGKRSAGDHHEHDPEHDDETAEAHDRAREGSVEAVAHARGSCGRVASWLGVVRRWWGPSAIRRKRTCARR